jgi:hypothetical protein
LIVGNNTDVGDVLVYQLGSYLYVEYLIADPTNWCMTMTHLAVGASLRDIPQTHRGNPIPNRFPYKGIFQNGCGSDFLFKINIAAFKPGTTLFIAAHAIVRHQRHPRHQETDEDEEDEVVRHYVGHHETYQYRTAWAAGSHFRHSRQATYFTFTVQDMMQEIPR